MRPASGTAAMEEPVVEPVPVGRKFSLYNGYWQVVLIGIVAFACPGMFNALTGMGGAGAADPQVSSFTNFCLYFSFAIFGYAGGLMYNYLGPRTLVVLGGITYSLYTIMAYAAVDAEMSSWGNSAFIASGALLGVGAAMFWTAQGSMMMAYAPQDLKGSYIALFWIIFNMGGVLGGLLGFATNFETESAGANAGSYFAFVGIMVAGAALGFLVMHPSKVIREDGVHAVAPPLKTFKEELIDVLLVCFDKNMLRLLILFFSSNFYYTYVFNGVNGRLHNPRTRGLNTAFFWGAQMAGSVLFARVVDQERLTLYARARRGFFLVLVIMSISWALGVYLEFGYGPALAVVPPSIRDDNCSTCIDCSSVDWIYPLFTQIFYGLADSLVQTFSYWLMSILADDNSQLAARYAGFYKGIQSLGAAIAWLIDSSYISASYPVQIGVCIALFVVGMVPTFFVVQELSLREVERPHSLPVEGVDSKTSSSRESYATPHDSPANRDTGTGITRMAQV